MVESRRRTESVPSDLLQTILEGDFRRSGFSEGSIRMIEEELQTYFPTKPDDCIGVIYHSGQSGWEKPVYRPEASDFDPRVQAVVRIGIQAEYRSLLAEALDMGKLAVSDYYSFKVIVMHSIDNRALVSTLVADGGLKVIARERKQEKPVYSSYVFVHNLEGDADFWGAYRNQIFPMEVKTENTEAEVNKFKVGVDDLGLDPDLVEETWRSWRDLFLIKSGVFGQAVNELATQKCFPDEFQRVIENKLNKGEKIDNWAKTNNLMSDLWRSGEDLDVQAIVGEFETTLRLINEAIDTWEMFEEEREEFRQTTRRLGEDLGKMYADAKDFVGPDLYPYA